ncbi:hypothetical protein DPMN_044906 [Dreissena polymorpha]|uniref:Uncharacterized protein n=1 Tax=Dreissena polymorpha TaxID=45954 RepID=A0A9D4D5D9_DREPO|nr:hypothetical protein DPMN_044906 [Dreissena polymorpha]
MATFSQSTIDKGSDSVQDFLGSTCKDKKLINTTDFYSTGQENPNKVIIVQDKSQQNVRISSDSEECNILDILVLED